MQIADRIDEILDAPSSKKKGRPISTVTVAGKELVLSRYGDDVIDMSPYIDNPGVAKRISMTRYPRRWQNSVLDLLLAFWRHGKPNGKVPKATTVVSRSTHLVHFVRWADAKGLKGFAEVKPLHVQQFIRKFSDAPTTRKKSATRSANGVAQTLYALSLAWHLKKYLKDALPAPPFGTRRTAGRAANANRSGTLKTQPFELNLALNLYARCKTLIDQVPNDLRDLRRLDELREKQPPSITTQDFSRLVQTELVDIFRRRRQISKNITMTRVACFTLVALLTGMRLHEILLLERNCWRESTWNGQLLGWICGRTLKTRPDGRTGAEWTAPLELKKVIDTLVMISERPRDKLLGEIGVIENDLRRKGLSPSARARLANRLRMQLENVDRLFLLRGRKYKKGAKGRTYTWDRANLAVALRELGKLAGIGNLHPHALRRTFAVILVHICGGDLRYLRVQFQHWSIETTAMYAQHDLRDQELVDEIAEEMIEYKTDLIAHWLNPRTKLAAPGGEYIKSQRETPIFRGAIRKSTRELATGIAPGLIIRPTGHSDCVSTGEMTCGGAGLYDAILCSDCESAVVGEKYLTIWELIGAQSLRLESLKEEGAVFEQLVNRSLESTDIILRSLGSSLDVVREKYRELCR